MLPGQVENWIFIVDMKGVNVTSVPYKMLKEVFGFMQNNYRAMLYKAYVLNAPWTFSALWKLAKTLLEETTQMKITITSSNQEEKMLGHINPFQLEKRYGGQSEECAIFWYKLI